MVVVAVDVCRESQLIFKITSVITRPPKDIRPKFRARRTSVLALQLELCLPRLLSSPGPQGLD